MTRRPTTPAPDEGASDTDDLDDTDDVDNVDDASGDRAESEWLLAVEKDPTAPPPSAQIGKEYAELAMMLSSLPNGPADDGWQKEVLRRAREQRAATPAPPANPAIASIASIESGPRRKWAWWSLGGGAALAAAAALLIWLLRPAPVALEVTTVSRLDKRTQDVAVGDLLVAEARVRGLSDLRVFRASGELLARCPEGPGCMAASQDELRIELLLDAPGRYHVVLIDGLKQQLPASTMDATLEAAHAAGARVMMQEREAR